MADPETLLKVRNLVAETSAEDPARINPDGKLSGYGIDSARVVELVIALEEEFNITIRETELANARPETVRDLARFVDRVREQRSAKSPAQG